VTSAWLQQLTFLQFAEWFGADLQHGSVHTFLSAFCHLPSFDRLLHNRRSAGQVVSVSTVHGGDVVRADGECGGHELGLVRGCADRASSDGCCSVFEGHGAARAATEGSLDRSRKGDSLSVCGWIRSRRERAGARGLVHRVTHGWRSAGCEVCASAVDCCDRVRANRQAGDRQRSCTRGEVNGPKRGRAVLERDAACGNCSSRRFYGRLQTDCLIELRGIRRRTAGRSGSSLVDGLREDRRGTAEEAGIAAIDSSDGVRAGRQG